MGLGNFFKKLAFGVAPKLGATLAAPFTGGASLAALPLIEGGLGALGAIQAGQQQGRANEASQQALDFARQDIEARQPFRDQLFASLQQGQPQRQDLSSLFGSQNPFASELGPLNPAQQQMAAPIAPPQGLPVSRRGGGSGRFSRIREDGRERLE
ncbi:hypothetical protein LCGC14_2749250 [marine sediment metagenome]|uniref:Uncharacterized protein n=1 Tax=marine sediment metagenome TaxID=412755 RepID=A0A0F9BAX0_9ZZZZ